MRSVITFENGACVVCASCRHGSPRGVKWVELSEIGVTNAYNCNVLNNNKATAMQGAGNAASAENKFKTFFIK